MKAFHRKTEQMRRVLTTGQASRRYSRSICPVFVGATLRGRPSMGKISFQCRPRWHATNFVHFAALLLMTGFSYIPQNRANAPSADDGTSVTPLLSVNLPGFRRGDPTWSPVNGKNFISMPSSLARDQLCSLRGFAPYDRFFLYPTKPSKCAECRRRGTR